MKKSHFNTATLIAIIIFSGLNVLSQSKGILSFKQHIIATGFTQGFDVFPADINQDGNMDFAAVRKGSGGELAWFESDNYFNYTKHSLKTGFAGARGVQVADLNGDNELDIIAAAWEANELICFLNDGDENFSEWIIDDNFIGAHTVDIKDVNEDGFMDVLCSGFDYYGHNGEIAWWENVNNTSFVKHLISDRFQQSPFVFCEDIDGDADMDVLACGELNNEVYWFENDGNEFFTEHMIDDNFTSAHTVFARDIDQDGHMDILGVACLSSKMAWWHNDGMQNFTRNNMPGFAGALWIDAADLDMDGDMDLYGCGMSSTYVCWWENDGSENFTRRNVGTSFSSGFAVRAIDMDGDTDLDLVAIGNSSNRISWFENQLINPSMFFHPECVVYDQDGDRYFVSNTCGVDSTGSIIEINSNLQQSVFISGIEDPLGMYLKGDTLLVSYADYGVVGFDITTKDSLFGVPLYPAGNSDGMTCDDSGNLYVLDTQGKLFKIDLGDLSKEVLKSGGMGSWPQDCVFDPFNNRILVAPYGQASSIYAVDPQTGESTVATTTTYGSFDGINIDPYGNIYLSTHLGGGQVLRYDNSLSNPPEVLSTGNNEPAGLCYNPIDKIVAVANFGGNSVSFISVLTTGEMGELPDKNIQGFMLQTYPNPCKENTIVSYELEVAETLHFQLISSQGSIIIDQPMGEKSAGKYTFNLSTTSYSPGVYFFKLSGSGNYDISKLIIR
ncbi:FG-GAP-like repeat-containing protein [Bacteroidota bacterium]